jgi:hypothetical protein
MTPGINGLVNVAAYVPILVSGDLLFFPFQIFKGLSLESKGLVFLVVSNIIGALNRFKPKPHQELLSFPEIIETL